MPATPWTYGKPHDYAHDVAGKVREAEVRDHLAAVEYGVALAHGGEGVRGRRPRHRAGLGGDCGYLTTAPGHLAECGVPGA